MFNAPVCALYTVSYILVEDQAGKNAISTFKKRFLKKPQVCQNVCLYSTYTLLHRHVSQCVCVRVYVCAVYRVLYLWHDFIGFNSHCDNCSIREVMK